MSIGPFFAIPRTATTAYEVGIAPMLPTGVGSIGLLIFTSIYFLAAFLIALNPSKILDRIGRILTPVFVILIIVLIILGAMKYSNHAPQIASEAYAQSAFGQGFLEGYNTLDALAAVAFSVIAVTTLNQLGFANKKEYVRTIWLVGLVVTLAFSILYVGLGYLGNHFPIPTEVMTSDTHKGVYVLSQATQAIFGSGSQIFLAAMVTVTCFTTTAGLIVSTGEFFHKRFPQISYKTYSILFTLIGFSIANLGLSTIINYSLPVLMILYPITITIVLLVILNKVFALSKTGMRLTILFVTLVSIAMVVVDHIDFPLLANGVKLLPFASLSLPWLVPALIGMVLSLILPDKQVDRL
ncbi:Branched-chain amino acid transport system carrier protein [Streptococcus sp. DD10]|nr:Branched-chain amino acid transport system carrier protein [Streptococcus sp. DD10]